MNCDNRERAAAWYGGRFLTNITFADKVSWVSPVDIAAAVAEEIVTPQVGVDETIWQKMSWLTWTFFLNCMLIK